MSSDAGFYLHIGDFDGFDRFVDFDKPKVRRAFRASGRLIQRSAQKLVSRSQRSMPGEYPGKRTGRLGRSIRVKVSRSGFLVRVAPNKIDMKHFYPAYLGYGVRRKSGARGKHASGTGGGLRVEPRANYMVDSKDARAAEIQALLGAAFGDALQIK